MALAVAAILPALISLGGIVRLRIRGAAIEQLLGPWVVAERPLSRLRRVWVDGRVFPVSLQFDDGATFRLLALHLRDRARLVEVLRTAAPEVVIE